MPPLTITLELIQHEEINNEHEEINYSNLKFHEEIGQGSFGTVHRVTFKKSFKGYKEAAAKSVRVMRREEVAILQKLNHPNIVTCLGFYTRSPVNLILMEYAKNGSLRNYLQDRSKPLSESLKRKWAKESALAIEYLHNHWCLHRDIKPNNCLLFENNTLKLCDFGLATEVENSFTLSTAKGTYQYMAPEIINTNADNMGSFSIYTDIYAYGMLLLAIYTRQTPFHGKDHGFVIYSVGNGTLQPDIPKDVPQDIAYVMKQCWEVEPRKRPTMKTILETSLYHWRMQRNIYTPQMKARRIALHPNGDMVVASTKQIHLLDSDGKVKRSLDSPDTGATWSEYIKAVSISPQGHVYVVERYNHLVRVFDESGTFLHNFSILPKGKDPSTPVCPECATIDRDDNLLVIDINHGITIHTCPGGEIICQIKININWHGKSINVRCNVNSKNQILLHYTSPYNSVFGRVVAIDYLGNELYSFTPKIDEDANIHTDNRLVTTNQDENVPHEEWVDTSGIVCDIHDNIFIALATANELNPVKHTNKVKRNTGHIHMYTPTGTFLKCIAKGVHRPHDSFISHDSSTIAVANSTSVLIYGLDQGAKSPWSQKNKRKMSIIISGCILLALIPMTIYILLWKL